MTSAGPPRAVLFDRDGTLVVDVPYNGDPVRVRPMPTAAATVDALRRAGVPVGVVSNQSGVGLGLITSKQMTAVNEEIDRRLGPFDVWCVCRHRPDDHCDCRKPRPGLVYAAAAALGIPAAELAVIGDIGADVEAAAAAGARSVLVPTRTTSAEEIASAPSTAGTLAEAVDLLFRGSVPIPREAPA